MNTEHKYRLNMNANELDKKLVEVAKFIDSVANNWQAIRTIESTRTMLRQQQAEMDIVIKLLCGEQISDDLMTHWNPLHSTLKSKLLKAQEK